MLERVPAANQIWQHYSQEYKQYKILGVSVTNRRAISGLYSPRLAKHSNTLEYIAIYTNVDGDLKLYYAKADQEEAYKSTIKVVKETMVVYQELYGIGNTWVLPLEEFLKQVNYQENVVNRFERIQ